MMLRWATAPEVAYVLDEISCAGAGLGQAGRNGRFLSLWPGWGRAGAGGQERPFPGQVGRAGAGTAVSYMSVY